MEYRTNKRTGDRISVIGLGTSYIAETEEKEAIRALEYAYENGINYADLATAHAKTFSYYGKAFSSVRKNLFYQVHFGADYESGSYGLTTDVETVRRSVDAQLTALRTDYIDYGFIHCLSEVDAVITTKVDSIKNPLSGRICVPEAGEVIMDDEYAKGEVMIGGLNEGKETYTILSEKTA